jgi:hypothetical protein
VGVVSHGGTYWSTWRISGPPETKTIMTCEERALLLLKYGFG